MSYRKYEQLFSLHPRHVSADENVKSYPIGTPDDFIVYPSAECERQLSNYGLLYHSKENQRLIFCEKTGQHNAASTPLRPIGGMTAFSFFMDIRNPNFSNYTALGTKPDNIKLGTYYLSNYDYQNNQLNDAEQLVAGEVSCSVLGQVSDADFIAIYPSKFSVPIEPVKHQEYRITSQNPAFPNRILTEKIAENANDRTLLPNALNIDMSGFPSGIYKLEVLGTDPVEQLFYLSDEAFRKRPFAIIDIFKDENVDYETNISYCIEFGYRSYHWRVIVYDEHSNGLPNAEIKNNIQQIAFESDQAQYPDEKRMEKKAQDAGHSLYILKSKTPIERAPVKTEGENELRDHIFTLKVNQGSNLLETRKILHPPLQVAEPRIFIQI